MKTFVVLSCLLAVAFAIPDLSQWNQWKSKHGRNYMVGEELHRMKIFYKNLKRIEIHNKKADAGKRTFRLGLNKFADLTAEEFGARFNGLKFNPMEHKQKNVRKFKAFTPLPTTVDWREKGVVAPIKNQGDCGSCWAFATIAATESAHALATKNLTLLSEQNLVDCSADEGNNGCDGGLMDYGFQYIIDNKGIDTEKSYPYEAEDEECQFKSRNVGATIASYVDIPSGDEKALQKATATIGPIAVGIDASSFIFQLYESGVYVDEECSTEFLDHGVTVVGYGKQNGQAFWTVRNSWGTDWGMDGYILMARNHQNMCGIATAASYPVV